MDRITTLSLSVETIAQSQLTLLIAAEAQVAAQRKELTERNPSVLGMNKPKHNPFPPFRG